MGYSIGTSRTRTPTVKEGTTSADPAQRMRDMDEIWLPSLITTTAQEGFELALKLSRKAVAAIQTSAEVRGHLRSAYEQDAAQLIHASHVVAVHFQTISAANGWWREAAQ